MAKSPGGNPGEDVLYFTCWRQKIKGKMPPEQGGTEESCNRGLAEHDQRQNSVVMSVGSRLPAFIDYKRFANKY